MNSTTSGISLFRVSPTTSAIYESRRQEVFNRVLEATKYYEPMSHTIASLSQPNRVTVRSLVVGNKEFIAARVQDENVLGIIPGIPNQVQYKGGIRMRPNAGPGKAAELAFEMSLKNAVIAPDLEDLDLLRETILQGGGKACIMADKEQLTAEEYHAIGREFAREFFAVLSDEKGNPIDVPAPDVDTDGQLMKTLMQEYSLQAGRSVYESFTGKPVEDGGILGRDEATARGGFIVLNHLISHLVESQSLIGLKVAIDGFGNAGAFMAKILTENGAHVVAFSDSKGACWKGSLEKYFTSQETDDIIAKKIAEKTEKRKIIDRNLSRGDMLALPVDVLILAAPDLTFSGRREKIDNKTIFDADIAKAKVMLESGNGMMDQEADKIVESKKITVLPDILANANGVLVSGLEILQNREWQKLPKGARRQWWPREKVLGIAKRQLIAATSAIWTIGQEHKISMRRATDVKALKTLDQAFRRKREMAYANP